MTKQLVPPRPLRGEVVSSVPVAPPSTMEWLDRLSFVMDRLFQIPGTRLRMGLNSLFLLIPVLGDILPTLISMAILVVGLTHYRVPRIVAARMLVNSLLDATFGWIPILGDLFDLFFKADTRNVRLLQEYVGQDPRPPRATWKHWVFVLGTLALLGLLLLLIVLGTIALGYGIARIFQRTP